MLPFPNALFARLPADAGNTPPAALDLDFAGRSYRANGTAFADLQAMPGHSFRRSGEQGAAGGDGTVGWFAPDVPAITAAGFHAYGPVTNNFIRSQAFDDPAWQKIASGPGASPPVVTANAAPAPDGSTSADRIQFSAPNGGSSYSLVLYLGPGGAGAKERGVWLRSHSGTSQNAIIYLTETGVGVQSAAIVTVTPAWRYFSLVGTMTGSGSATLLFGAHGPSGSPAAGVGSDGTLDLDVWQGQCLDGAFADGGPLIRTAGASAGIGASALSLGLANGNYRATYFFDDGTIQVTSCAVGSGAFDHPVFGALSRGIVARTLVEAA